MLFGHDSADRELLQFFPRELFGDCSTTLRQSADVEPAHINRYRKSQFSGDPGIAGPSRVEHRLLIRAKREFSFFLA